MAAAPKNSPVRYQIDDLILDTESRSVTRGDESLNVAGLTFDLMLALAEAAPSTASYDYLIERVWKGRDTSPETISQRAKILRGAISDHADAPRYFELVRGQGYRIVPEVRTGSAESSPRPSRRGIAIAAIAAIVAVLGIALFVGFYEKDRQIESSVAVLPFEDFSEAGDQQFWADGIAEELINELTLLDGLDVASRTESFSYRGPSRDLEKIGEDLGVATVLEGSIRKSEDSLRITVQLVEVDSGYHLWSQNFDAEFSDIFDVQESIAASVAGALGVKLGVGGVNEFRGAGTRNSEAYEAFLRGEFEKAIELDPNYAAAWSRRGLDIASTMWINDPADAPEILQRALVYVAKAVELDPESSQAHIDYATVMYATMNWMRAEELYARALDLNRNRANLSHYANMLMRSGRSARSMEYHQMADALQRVPGIGGSRVVFRSFVYTSLGDADAVRELLTQMPSPIAEFNALNFALNFGTHEDVLAAVDAIPANTQAYLMFYGPLAEHMTSPDAAMKFLTELADNPHVMWPFKYENIALMAAYFDEPEFAFDVFSNELPYTTIRYATLWYPVMSELRKLPEFKELMVDVNLVEFWRNHGWSDYCHPISEDDFVCE